MLTMSSSYHRLHISIIALAAALAGALSPGAAAARAATLVIEGAGDGHGVGMSQEGAFGYAQRGASYEQILAHYYSGTALGTAPAAAQVRVLVGSRVQQVPLETYVRGVVSAEMPASWPLAALEAQAVASRTYALTAHAGGARFDVYSDTRSQVYRGVAAHTPQTDAAVAATAGQVVTYAGRPAITYFFASSGGRTENVEQVWPGGESEPWLKGVLDPYDQGPLHHWRLTLELRHGVRPPARPRARVLSGHRGAQARLLAAHPVRLRARLGWTHAGQRRAAAGGARAVRDVGLLQPAVRPHACAPSQTSAASRRRFRRRRRPPRRRAPAPQGGLTAPSSAGLRRAA